MESIIYILLVSDNGEQFEYQYGCFQHANAHFKIAESAIMYAYDCKSHDYSILKSKFAKDIFSFKDNEAILI